MSVKVYIAAHGNEEGSHMIIDRDDFIMLMIEYKKAADAGAETFRFNSRTLVVQYAKYMIEFLQPKFK